MRIRVTHKGILYSMSAGILCFIGSRYAVLVSSLCGLSVVIYSVYAFLGSIVTAQRWKAAKVTISIHDSTISLKLLYHSGRFPVCAAGIIVQYALVLRESFHADSHILHTVVIPFQKNKIVYHTALQKRCRYVCKEQFIIIEDFARFFTITVPQKQNAIDTGYFFCVPPPVSTHVPQAEILQHLIQHHTDSFQPDMDVYESRLYFPGDDPRKIHWKIYAHTHTLALKLGEKDFFSAKTFAVYIEEPYITKKSELPFALCTFDAFIERILFFLSELLNKGIRLTIFLYCHCGNTAAGHTDPAPKKLNQYALSPDAGAEAHRKLQELCAIPQPRFLQKNIDAVQMNIRPHPIDLYHAAQKAPLLYFYLPRIQISGIPEKHIFIQQTTPPCTFFIGTCSKKPPQPHKPIVQHLVYDTYTDKKKERYARLLSQAAERDAALVTAGHAHAHIF